MAYATVKTLSHNFGRAPLLLAAPAVSLRHHFYPGDIAAVQQTTHFPYPADFDFRPPDIRLEEITTLDAPQKMSPSLHNTILRWSPQPQVLAASAGFSTIPTTTPHLWRRCRDQYKTDLLARSPHGFIDCLINEAEIGFCLAYIIDSFHDGSGTEYLNRRRNTFEALAAVAEELICQTAVIFPAAH